MIKTIRKAVLKTIPRGRAVENIAWFVAAPGTLIRRAGARRTGPGCPHRFRPKISAFGWNFLPSSYFFRLISLCPEEGRGSKFKLFKEKALGNGGPIRSR